MLRFEFLAGTMLGMRRNFGNRRFDEMPSFYHHFMAITVGTMTFLLGYLNRPGFTGDY